MFKSESLRQFVSQRLTAAAEEIYIVFTQTIVEYEEEIERQRKLLDIVWKPHVRLHRTELPQQHVCKDEVDQQLCDRERSPSLDQDDPDPPQIKEELQDLCSTQEGEQLGLKLETEPSMVTPTPPDTPEDLSEPEPQGRHGDSGSARPADPKPKHTYNVHSPNESGTRCDTQTGPGHYKCDTCGKDFKYKYYLKQHMRVHTGEKPFTCTTCGKSYRFNAQIKLHMMIHTGERPFTCITCGKSFTKKVKMMRHMRIHTGEKPFTCTTCGKSFTQKPNLTSHMRVHTGERPFTCTTCGNSFKQKSKLISHMRVHTGERPFTCTTCGSSFKQKVDLGRHMRVHTGEKLKP